MLAKDLVVPLPDRSLSSKPEYTTQRVRAVGGIKLVRDSIPDRFVVGLGLLVGYGLACLPGAPRYIIPTLLGAYTLSIPLRAYATHLGWLRNDKTARVVRGRATVRWPAGSRTRRERREGTTDDAEGEQEGDEDEEQEGQDKGEMCIVLLTARSNAPLGLFDPAFRRVGASFQAMNAALLADPESGVLNVDPYTGRHRETSNTILGVYYFRDEESVIRFARNGLHRSAWMEVARNPDKYADIELGHELFVVKRGTFEASYLNCEPKGAGEIYERVRVGGGAEGKEAGKEAEGMSEVWRSVLRQKKDYKQMGGK